MDKSVSFAEPGGAFIPNPHERPLAGKCVAHATADELRNGERVMNRITVRIVFWFAKVALSSVLALAQTETGQISGTIKDASGAVVSGAKVTVTSLGTGLTRDTTTNPAGIFTIPSLRPDEYKVVIEAQGFQPITEQVKVAVGADTDVS